MIAAAVKAFEIANHNRVVAAVHHRAAREQRKAPRHLGSGHRSTRFRRGRLEQSALPRLRSAIRPARSDSMVQAAPGGTMMSGQGAALLRTYVERFQPSQLITPWPMTSSRSRPLSHGSSSVNIVTHSR